MLAFSYYTLIPRGEFQPQLIVLAKLIKSLLYTRAMRPAIIIPNHESSLREQRPEGFQTAFGGCIEIRIQMHQGQRRGEMLKGFREIAHMKDSLGKTEKLGCLCTGSARKVALCMQIN